MNKQRLSYLFQKYINKTASQIERDEFMLYMDKASEQEITPLLEEAYNSVVDVESQPSKEERENILKAVFEHNQDEAEIKSIDDLKTVNLRRKPFWLKLSSIAALLLVGLTISFLYYTNHKKSNDLTKVRGLSLSDLEPGGNNATLTLADGSIILLNDIKDGKVAEQSGIVITKTDDGQLLYTLNEVKPRTGAEGPDFNTISTPRGGQYQIILPDGTKVWLNAASSLKYPVLFSKHERKVDLIGEAYFEVKKNETSPFIVSTDDQTVTVLGTHFNINSYKDDSEVKTTLLEGSVMVSAITPTIDKNINQRVLKPGEQSVLNSRHDLKVSKVNVSNVIAWKNGLFHFENTNIREVMEEFSRWYNVDFEFEGEMPNVKLWGSAYRNVNASEALDILSYFNLKFRFAEASIANGKKKIVISKL